MGKYRPLRDFLCKQQLNEIRMTFDQIERVIGEKLPPKAQHYRAWWSNSPTNNVMTQAWLDAGFRSEQVDMQGRKVVFRKVAPQNISMSAASSGSSKHHPMIGCMRGTVTVAPDVDLAEPADPAWGDVAYGGD